MSLFPRHWILRTDAPQREVSKVLAERGYGIGEVMPHHLFFVRNEIGIYVQKALDFEIKSYEKRHSNHMDFVRGSHLVLFNAQTDFVRNISLDMDYFRNSLMGKDFGVHLYC